MSARKDGPNCAHLDIKAGDKAYVASLEPYKIHVYEERGVKRKRLELLYTSDAPWPCEVIPKLKYRDGDGYVEIHHPEYQTRRLYVDAKNSWTFEVVPGPSE